MPKRPPLPPALAILREVCLAHGYSFEELDPFARYLARVGNGTISYFAGASNITVYPLNAASAQGVARDKSYSYAILAQGGFQVPRSRQVFVTEQFKDFRPQGRELSTAVSAAESIGFPVFVKPNQGSGAKGAQTVHDPDELVYSLVEIAKSDYSALIQEFLGGAEFRLFVLDGQVQFGYRKSRPVVVGDGCTSVEDLIVRDRLLVQETYLKHQLSVRSLGLASCLPAAAQVETSPIANLSSGGRLVEFFTEVPSATAQWVERLANTMLLRVFSVDFFGRNGISQPDDFIILEVNATPALATIYALGQRKIVREVWARILRLHFELNA